MPGTQAEPAGVDRPSLTLPGDANALVSAVARANPRTVVVLNTGGAVLMPWLHEVRGVLEAWYPGVRDGTAHYAEGLDVGYRWDLANRIRPLCPFGFGLAHTSFRLSGDCRSCSRRRRPEGRLDGGPRRRPRAPLARRGRPRRVRAA